MKIKHSSYPSIGQFRNLVRNITDAYGYSETSDGTWHRDSSKKLPVLPMKITTKVHGTNAGVLIHPDLSQSPQSKSQSLTALKDNAGFFTWHHSRQDYFSKLYTSLVQSYPKIKSKSIVVYGEFAGGNIQKNVGVSGLEKFLYIFGIKVIEESDDISNWWIDCPVIETDEDKRIFPASVIGTISIDFDTPELYTNKLVEYTESVENNCPVAKHLSDLDNVVSTNTIGEGIVLSHITPKGELLQCKVKGEKHSSSKVKKLAAVDTEKLSSINEFVEYAVTKNRLDQMALEVLNNDFGDRKKLGSFIKAVTNDVIKEEMDTLSNANLTMKDVCGAMSKRSKNYFFDNEKM